MCGFRFTPAGLVRTMLVLSLSISAAACTGIDHTFPCTAHEDCVRGGIQGRCRAESFCAFRDTTCDSGERWDSSAAEELSGICVGERASADRAGQPGVEGGNDCGGSAVLAGRPSDTCGPCGAGTWVCDGPDSVRCEGELTLEEPVTTGSAVAETTAESFLQDYSAAQVLDGNQQTSWFSGGPDADGSPTEFRWLSTRQHCLKSIIMIGNQRHPTYPNGYGFGQVTVQVRDAGKLQFSQRLAAPQTQPNGAAMLDTGGVRGDEIVLLLSSHEHTQCGGFSELVVNEVR